MHARRPFMVPAAEDDWTLVFIKSEVTTRVGRIVVLEVVARMVVLVFDQQQRGILRSDLLLDSAVPFDAVEIVVWANPVVVFIIEVKRVTGAAKGAELGSQLL